MSSNTPVEVVADPKKPYKAYIATGIAFLGLIWANLQGVENWGELDFQDWVTIIVPAILVFGGTYWVENPKVAKGLNNVRRNDTGEVNVISAIVYLIVFLLLVFLVVFIVRAIAGSA